MTNNIKNYNKSFQITENIGNNIFCFDKIKNSKIHIPSLISLDISDFKQNITNYIKIWTNSVFREERNWKIIEYKWLKNFIEINNNVISSKWNESRNPLKNKKAISPLQSKWQNQTIYIIDNHNHALYFRYKEYFNWNIQKWCNLIHIDQHTDMNENKFHITLPSPGSAPTIARVLLTGEVGWGKLENLLSDIIFHFTNYKCNVWNFIKPAIEEWLIWNITQINTEYSLLNIKFSPLCWKHERGDRGDFLHTQIEILDIDLDFRAPEMSIQKYQKTIDITKTLIQNSRVVTIATSPYFLDQNLAIKIIKDLFN